MPSCPPYIKESICTNKKYIDDESQDEDKNNSLPDTVITDIPTQPAQGTQEGSDGCIAISITAKIRSYSHPWIIPPVHNITALP